MTKTRCAIVGTADSWTKTPWTDPDITIVGLNDAYALGFPRVDEWYELHPLSEMWFKPHDGTKVVYAHDVPKGAYIRPQGHLDWLKAQAQRIPVWLQATPPDDWPANASRFPIEAVEAAYGSYWASGPAYELMHLYSRGYREFQIYGIHLSTDGERLKQRHNFEFLLGRLLGPHVTETRDEAKGLRIYTGADVTIVLPVESPILSHGWRYAYEKAPEPKPNPFRDELARVRARKAKLVAALVRMTDGPDKQAALDDLDDLEIAEIDCAQMLQRSHLNTAPIVAVLGG